MKSLLVVALGLSLWMAPELSFAKDCKKGKPCGEACIPKNKECTIAPAAAAAPKKECKKGKPCGNACIAKDKVCKADTK